MILPDGTPSVLEFNARFGDPETQVLLPALLPGFSEHLVAIAQRRWNPVVTQQVLTVERAAVTTSWPRGLSRQSGKGGGDQAAGAGELGRRCHCLSRGHVRRQRGETCGPPVAACSA